MNDYSLSNKVLRTLYRLQIAQHDGKIQPSKLDSIYKLAKLTDYLLKAGNLE